MATLEDKLLGDGKLQNYCSSSEDEGLSDDEDNRSGDEEGNARKPEIASAELPPPNDWRGTASNTGPKGVIADWKKFKRLEAEKRKEEENEVMALAKKLTMSVKTLQEEEKDKEVVELEEELGELLDEDFLHQYQKKRMQELMKQLKKAPKFGKVITLNSQEEFLNAVDSEDINVTVVIHLYNDTTTACETMDGCLNVLAADYPSMKYCRIHVSIAGMSRNFRDDGVPALLVYKGGQIIGNFVQISSELGTDFYAVDVQRFLIEYGMLPEN